MLEETGPRPCRHQGLHIRRRCAAIFAVEYPDCNQSLEHYDPAKIIFQEAILALIQHVALVSESNLCKMDDLLRVSAALQKQASRDLGGVRHR